MIQHNISNWQQQQQQPPHPQTQQQVQQEQNVANANMPHMDETMSAEHWRQSGMPAPVDQQKLQQSFAYAPQPSQPIYPNYVNYQRAVPQNQQSQNPYPTANYFQQQPAPAQDYFDNGNNANNNNNNSKGDGWGDWGDWNENNLTIEQHQQQQPQPPPHNNQQFSNHAPQQHVNNANVIDDSFSTSGNDNWHFNMSGAEPTNAISQPLPAPVVAEAMTNILPPPPAMQTQVPNTLKPQPPVETTNEQLSHLPTIASSTSINATSSANNIPNSVYVSQAKPVTKPPRLYASPPSGNTPNEALPPVDSVFAPPPEGFQNEPPKVVAPPPSVVGATAGNPFKRAGTSQHHRAGFIATTTPVAKHVAPILPTFAAPHTLPMPPALPVQANFEQPDNSEILHENQEVPTPFPMNESIAAAVVAQQQPFNDERNQYLQTSHLSENPVEDLNVEADSLPPPGLSRLVLGQPELEANQRLVTGTEDTLNDLVVNMSLEERQADGEDDTTNATATTALAPRGPNALSNNSSSLAPTVNTGNLPITTDRNLYLVPGESNANNELLPRVLTGFDNAGTGPIETISQPTVATVTQHISEQREIELDGENLEDQQQQRNEPPVEGAAAQQVKLAAVPAVATEAKEALHHHHNHYQQTKSNNNLPSLSTGNEESDHVPDHHKKYGGKSRTKQHVDDKRADKEHMEKQQTSDTEEYSSERERDRERDRERNRQRRHFREGSVRSEHDRERERVRERERERDWEREDRKRRDKRDVGEKQRDKYYRELESGAETRSERRSQRYQRYDPESSHEEGSRKEKVQGRRNGRDNRERDRYRDRENDRRGDREYDEFNRRYRNSKRNVERDDQRRNYADEERREEVQNPRTRRDRENYDTIERRRHRTADKNHTKPRAGDIERDARDSDLEKERGSRYDPRYGYQHAQAGVYGGYDPYTYYYMQMARYNPQAYREMYKEYYGSHGPPSAVDVSGINNSGVTGTGSDHLTGDGRESVHSGRSSVQNEQER